MALDTGLTTSDLAIWLRIGDDEAIAEQEVLEMLISAAEEIVENELGHNFEGEDIPEQVRKSILKLATSDYERRQAGLEFETLSVHQSNYKRALDEIRGDLWPYRKIVGF